MAILVLDAGHSGPIEPGACGQNGLRECDVTLEICQMLKPQLEAAGHTVLMTRDGDIDTDDLEFRVDLANEAGADAFLSIHCNAAANVLARGTETFKYRGSVEGGKLAQCIQEELINNLGTIDRGVKEAGYYVLKYTNMPAALIELAFISNEQEEAKLGDITFKQLACQAIIAGLRKYLG